MAHPSTLYATLLCALLLSACGWHLRGTQGEALALGDVYLTAQDLHGDLAAELRRQLGARGATLVSSPSEADYLLTIMDEDFDRRTAGVGADALASAYELIWIAHFALTDRSGQTLLAPATQSSVTRLYDQAPGASASQEERLLRSEMARDLARQILGRVQAAASTEPDTSPEAD